MNKKRNGKKKEQKEERTHCSSVGREGTAHDIRITRHDALSSKAIRAISIDCPRDVWRINGLTNSRSPLLQFPVSVVMTSKEKERRKRVSAYTWAVREGMRRVMLNTS